MDKIRIKFGGYQGPDSINTAAARTFGSQLLEAAMSTVAFELEESVLDLGLRAGDLPEMVASGELDLCYTSSIRCAKVVPELSIFELPYLINDRTALFSALDGELGRFFCARVAEETPYMLLGFWDNGFRHISNSVRPIRTPEDCQGLTIRTQMSELHGDVFRAFGFKPTGTDIKDFIADIATGRFQAQDNPLTNIYNFDVHKHHRYITLSGHFFGLTVLLCNREIYQSWPAAIQESVVEAANTATAHQRQLAREQDDFVLSKLSSTENEVIVLRPEERNAFEEKVAPLRESHKAKFGPELFERLGI